MNYFEILYLPSSSGLIKVYVYGFAKSKPGKVFATLNDTIVSSKGYNRYRTIIKALTKLHESYANQNKPYL